MLVAFDRNHDEGPLARGSILAGRFTITARLGAGAFGEVYEAYDEHHGARVALKLLRRAEASMLLRFKREFRALTDVIHPNLVVLYELFVDQGRWFFTMERLHGSDIVEYTRKRPSEVRAVMRQLGEGVAALHTHGMVHRDLKPSNVMVTPSGRVVILDFGLVAAASYKRSARDGAYLLGTPAYIAPEQFAEAVPTAASDWYSVGTILYEALTGRLPFEGSVRDVVIAKRNGNAPRISDRCPTVDPELDAIATELMRRDASHRPTGPEILERLGSSRIEVRTHEEVLVGREAELASLHEAYGACRGAHPVVVITHGGSGAGKTSLVRHFLDRLMREEDRPLVAHGRCHERESVPYKAFDGLIDALAPRLRGLANEMEGEIPPSDRVALMRLFPVLRFVSDTSRTHASLDDRELRRSAFRALRALLRRLAQQTPVVAFIDDLQWGDADSASLFQSLLRGVDAPSILWIAACRTEELTNAACISALRAVADFRDVPVGPLTRDDAERLAGVLLGDVSEPRGAWVQTAIDEAEGHPLFLTELVRAGASHEDLAGLIRTRLDALSVSERSLLELVSLRGAPLQRELLVRAVAIESQEALTRLRAARLVRASVVSDVEHVEPYHDRIRDAVVSSMQRGVLENAHRRLAVALSSGWANVDSEALAHHWEGCGELERAAEHVREAADTAAAALAFDRAASLYRKCIALSRSETHSTLYEQLGKAAWNAGRGVEAAESFLAAAQDRNEPLEALELRRRAAESYLYCGRVEEGRDLLRSCFSALGMPMYNAPAMAVVGWLLERARLRFQRSTVRPINVDPAPEDRLRMDTCWSAAQGLGWTNPMLAPQFVARGIRIATRCGDLGRLARFLADDGLIHGAIGEEGRKEAARLFERARVLAERAGDKFALGVVRLDEGTTALSQGEWRKSKDTLEEALVLLRAHGRGVLWETVNGELLTFGAMFYLGERDALIERFPRVLAEADERGDRHGAVNLRLRNGYLVELLRGRDDDAERMVAEARARLGSEIPGLQHLFYMMALAEIALFRGRGADAWRVIEMHWEDVRSTFVMRVSLMSLMARDVRARAALAASRELAGSESQRLLAIARSEIRRIAGIKGTLVKPFANALAGSLAWITGDEARARETWGCAEEGFLSADMTLHAAAARSARLASTADHKIARMLVVQP